MRRFRRLRSGEQIRSLVRETRIDKGDLIYPIFIAEGENIKKPVDSMPNVYQYSLDRADEILKEIESSGIAGLLIFGIPKHKDELATSAYDDNGVTQNAIRYIKKNYPSLLIIADVCLCEYTSHGHCGVVCGHEILNDETLPLLSKMAVSLAKAGADIIAPSDMMDGRVSARRGFLKFGLGAALAGAVSGLGFNLRPAFAQAKEFKLKWTKQTTSICCYCAVGCGLIVSTSTSDNPLGKGRAINVEGDPDHPINEGSLCPKGASTWQLTVNDQRPKKPLYRAPHATEWKEVEWEWAMEEIAKRVKESRDKSFTEKNDKG